MDWTAGCSAVPRPPGSSRSGVPSRRPPRRSERRPPATAAPVPGVRSFLPRPSGLTDLSPGLSDLSRLIKDVGYGGAQDGGQLLDLVAARGLAPSRCVRCFDAQQAVQLGVDVQDGILVVVGADQENPRSRRRLERDNYPQRLAQVLDAQVVDRRRAAESIGECRAATGGEIIQKPIELLGPPSIQSIYLLTRARRGEDFRGHGPGI
jgi:hypothetical protein